MSQQPKEDFNKEAINVSKGGIWADENLEQSLDWNGESGSERASVDKDIVRTPRTYEEVNSDVLSSAQITSDVINIITARVEKSILRSSGSAEQTIIQMVDAKLDQHGKLVRKWIDGQNTRLMSMEEMMKDSKQPQIDRLDEKLASLELKIDSVIGNMTQHGPEEARMLHEAYKIITERRSSDDVDASEPSIYERMEKRIGSLNEQLKAIEPFANDGIKAKVVEAKSSANVRRRFGKMM
jgi:hypothetical protein